MRKDLRERFLSKSLTTSFLNKCGVAFVILTDLYIAYDINVAGPRKAEQYQTFLKGLSNKEFDEYLAKKAEDDEKKRKSSWIRWLFY